MKEREWLKVSHDFYWITQLTAKKLLADIFKGSRLYLVSTIQIQFSLKGHNTSSAFLKLKIINQNVVNVGALRRPRLRRQRRHRRPISGRGFRSSWSRSAFDGSIIKSKTLGIFPTLNETPARNGLKIIHQECLF